MLVPKIIAHAARMFRAYTNFYQKNIISRISIEDTSIPQQLRLNENIIHICNMGKTFQIENPLLLFHI